MKTHTHFPFMVDPKAFQKAMAKNAEKLKRILKGIKNENKPGQIIDRII